MFDSPLGFAAYVGLKLAAYILWCYVGVRWLTPSQEKPFKRAAKLGVARLFIGVAFGIGIFIVGGIAHLEPWNNRLAQYFVIYAPVRWVEWGILSMILLTGTGSARRLLLGDSASSRLWRLGGIVVSHLADLPVILAMGGVSNMLPVGRFLC